MRLQKYINEGKQDFWQKMEGADYLVRELSPNEYEVTKWTRGDTPTNIYKCYDRGRGNRKCSCPSRKAPCVHVKEVQDWLKKGKKEYYSKEKLTKYMKAYLDEAIR